MIIRGENDRFVGIKCNHCSAQPTTDELIEHGGLYGMGWLLLSDQDIHLCATCAVLPEYAAKAALAQQRKEQTAQTRQAILDRHSVDKAPAKAA